MQHCQLQECSLLPDPDNDSFTLRDDIRIAETRVIIAMPPFIVRMNVTMMHSSFIAAVTLLLLT